MRKLMTAAALALSALFLAPAPPAEAAAYNAMTQQKSAEVDKSAEQVHWRKRRRGIYFSFGYGYPRYYGYRSYYRPYYYRPHYYSYPRYYKRHRHWGYRRW